MDELTSIVIDVALSLTDVPHGGGSLSGAVERSKRTAKRTLGLQTVSASAQRLLSSLGNEDLSQIGSALGTFSKYGGMVSNALSGNPAALLTLTTSVLSEAVTAVVESLKADAADKNATDAARVAAGVMDVSGTTIQTNPVTGRKVYVR